MHYPVLNVGHYGPWVPSSELRIGILCEKVPAYLFHTGDGRYTARLHDPRQSRLSVLLSLDLLLANIFWQKLEFKESKD